MNIRLHASLSYEKLKNTKEKKRSMCTKMVIQCKNVGGTMDMAQARWRGGGAATVIRGRIGDRPRHEGTKLSAVEGIGHVQISIFIVTHHPHVS